MSGSNSSVVEISRSRRRFVERDALLAGYVGNDWCTAKEVAVDVLGWVREPYANCPKRAHDLFLLDYLQQGVARKCRETGKLAHTYSITDKGRVYLRKRGVAVVDQVVSAPPANMVNARDLLSDLKNRLGG
ncbi:MAG: hypothetical protein M0R47_17025 [Methylobacter sp.]|uniref:hypothetical protein n=1 Tax=Methylobacter sp. TaxID=2051955 RepID=UPI0025E33212|nr:hypothetical protein [Methylobacter sp.]MCK9622227.1 hypothetical protein [Methylobacter sp.]